MYHFLEKFLREGSLKRSRDNISGVIRVYSGDTDGFVGGDVKPWRACPDGHHSRRCSPRRDPGPGMMRIRWQEEIGVAKRESSVCFVHISSSMPPRREHTALMQNVQCSIE